MDQGGRVAQAGEQRPVSGRAIFGTVDWKRPNAVLRASPKRNHVLRATLSDLEMPAMPAGANST